MDDVPRNDTQDLAGDTWDRAKDLACALSGAAGPR